MIRCRIGDKSPVSADRVGSKSSEAPDLVFRYRARGASVSCAAVVCAAGLGKDSCWKDPQGWAPCSIACRSADRPSPAPAGRWGQGPGADPPPEALPHEWRWRGGEPHHTPPEVAVGVALAHAMASPHTVRPFRPIGKKP